MKQIITCLLLMISTIFCVSATSQTLDRFKTKAAEADSLFSSRMTIHEYGSVSSAVRALESPSTSKTIRGYRVSIYIGNSQNARSVSQAEMNRFAALFPDIPVYMSYNIPDFKVTVGNCLSSDEAIIIWGRVKSAFDRASVIREEIPISYFGSKIKKPAEITPNSETQVQ